uniref:Uncharacterized protein n=1 Tax=Anguilla anguilla TaxID=7936 RepID=A0A0E9RQH0_ANGAN
MCVCTSALHIQHYSNYCFLSKITREKKTHSMWSRGKLMETNIVLNQYGSVCVSVCFYLLL